MPLLGDLQRVFENTYGKRAGVDLEECVVGERRCAELAARSPLEHDEMSRWARFFYYMEDRNLRLALFYGAEMITVLEDRDPRRSLSESNVLPFLVLTEELSHAVHTTYAFDENGPSRIHAPEFLVELELMARVDSYLLLRHFVRRLADRYTPADRAWVRHQAVTRWEAPYADTALEERYQGAARLAAPFVDHLEGLPPARLLSELRRFRRLSLAAKRKRIARLN